MKKTSCSLILILGILLAGCAGPTSSAPAPTTAPTPATAPGIVTASVNVVPVDKSDLAFIISGPVKRVDVAEGDQVKAGQALVELDAPDLAFAVTGAQADLRSAQDYAFLQNYFRKTLIGSNWVSTNGAPELRQMAAAKVQKAQAALDSAQAALKQATLPAPYAGTIVSINVTPGEHVQSGQVVAVIADLTRLQIETKDLSEREIASVQVGQKATIRLKSFAQDLGGRVIRIAQMSSIYNGDNVFKVTIQLDSQPAGLLWGMSGDVEIHTKEQIDAREKENIMTLPTRIAVIGAGSASFGGNTLSALMHSKKLRGSSIALVDRNKRSLDIVKRLADRLNREWDAQMDISAHLHHHEALEGAQFVVSAIEVGAREGLWRSDYEIPLKYGVRQPYAENGGPGGFAHAARNIGPVMQIVRDMEKVCPQAWFINFTNPMMRICDAVNRHSRIKAVGLCHQIYAGYSMVGVALANELGIEVPPELTGMHAALDQAAAHELLKRQIVPLLDIRAAGLNHFTWMLSVHDKKTGEDLYPLFRKRFFELDPQFEPLTRDVFSIFGLFPVPGDTHLCEYLPWVSDQQTKPWEKYNIRLYDWDVMASVRDFELDRLNQMADGAMTLAGLQDTDSEGALEMIENMAGAGSHSHLAANLPNQGQISNLPEGATVETPVTVDGSGVHPIHTGALPEPVAELCRREIRVAQLCVDSAVEGDREKALQSLLLDPVITDIQAARNILNDYLMSYKEYLPQFWK